MRIGVTDPSRQQALTRPKTALSVAPATIGLKTLERQGGDRGYAGVMARLHPITAEALKGMLTPEVEQVLARPGVLKLPDGRMVKSFRKAGGWLSSARWRPYALRFVRAAAEMGRRGVATVRVQAAYRVSPSRRDVVVYLPLAGTPLRQRLEDEDALGRFARFLAGLHERGVHPRSMHLGNVILDGQGGMGVIDVTAARFYRRAAPPAARARDFRPLLRYEPEATAIKGYGVRRFVDAYLEAAALTPRRRGRLLRHLARQDAVLAEAVDKGAPQVCSRRATR